MFSVASIGRSHRGVISLTWLMVLAENGLMVLLPLLIGNCIDDLLDGQSAGVINLGMLLLALVVLGVARRFYDTRVYGSIRVSLGIAVQQHLQGQALSSRNARLDMSRELVDFLENEVPPLLTAVIQIVAAIVILATFSPWLSLSAILAGGGMLLFYACVHQRFIRLNQLLNNQRERQVSVLASLSLTGLRVHLRKLRSREVRLSDTEALLYGLIFILLFGFVLTNLYLTAQLVEPSTGTVFAILSYSLEFVEAAVLLPITLQGLSRLAEISSRLQQVESLREA
ncbi:ABC transporter six-transmembrane domain-containing protein [Balneatrix alpica]|uniref:ABC transporter six-transmembrane domain-containing protein n=1 Tax=Balneatrix alpica TaxID=75684 RepID=A0ABV5ZB26_9GAMM|nr:ABC transporter six-transmembrane domain-containing protein [Balneatrix alpica]